MSYLIAFILVMFLEWYFYCFMHSLSYFIKLHILSVQLSYSFFIHIFVSVCLVQSFHSFVFYQFLYFLSNSFLPFLPLSIVIFFTFLANPFFSFPSIYALLVFILFLVLSPDFSYLLSFPSPSWSSSSSHPTSVYFPSQSSAMAGSSKHQPSPLQFMPRQPRRSQSGWLT